ncbi:nucleotide sugar dehydrogenase [Prochlorococcus marinus]|uniref:nucleotide sugar dehydrogenase n=1 Tax=Prochlorococcus marinus TaxID=1219 RepID=UPI001ADBFBC7|nr:nucleotide sugar dehydrogenase [Prochlorococcus marinus]MBO8204934.1 nucleotide sugar dehydrogenase [Prochlorococcus marinus CUG1415]MBW3044206.1 Vi polysaccharide biosynthesis protein VipA/TviB [Prochlorococcus marinus str. MU1415]
MEYFDLPQQSNCTIVIIGLGYVGLPLAIEFAKNIDCNSKKILKRKIIGFDINLERVNALKNGIDITKEINFENLKYLNEINLTNDMKILNKADIFIVTVPTPIDKKNAPDLNPIKKASEMIGKVLKLKGKEKIKPIIIYESTVFPGATEEICVPIIEKESKSKLNKDFFCGYSPERINPGDNKNKLNSIIKVTSGSNEQSALWINELYKSIIKAGTHMTSSIKIAETAKVIENTQRDLNIALMNELAKICDLVKIDTLEVIKAASTKWNFLDFRPGLVGGHCIGVDPYYLTYKSETLGYKPEVVLAGRKINNSMPRWILKKIISELENNNLDIQGANILLMGITFKENCPDIRNSKIFELIHLLNEYNVSLTIWDSWANVEDCKNFFNLEITNNFPKNKKYTSVICLVKHNEFAELRPIEWESLIIKNGIFFDLKGIIPRQLKPIRP